MKEITSSLGPGLGAETLNSKAETLNGLMKLFSAELGGSLLDQYNFANNNREFFKQRTAAFSHNALSQN